MWERFFKLQCNTFSHHSDSIDDIDQCQLSIAGTGLFSPIVIVNSSQCALVHECLWYMHTLPFDRLHSHEFICVHGFFWIPEHDFVRLIEFIVLSKR